MPGTRRNRAQKGQAGGLKRDALYFPVCPRGLDRHRLVPAVMSQTGCTRFVESLGRLGLKPRAPRNHQLANPGNHFLGSRFQARHWTKAALD